ncbi:MAG: FAD-dependent oxidoreductase, partial [Chloroflexota bacterium]
QKRVFRMIPGFEQAEFVRYWQMHRNTFIASPKLLDETMQFRAKDELFFAGQIVGVEGYVGNIASGLVAGMNLARSLYGEELVSFPLTTMVGALMHYIAHAEAQDFQPMKANFGLFPPLSSDLHLRKKERYQAYGDRALKDLQAYISSQGIKKTIVL